MGRTVYGWLCRFTLAYVPALAQAGVGDLLHLDTHAIIQYGVYNDAVDDQGRSLSNRTGAAGIVDLVLDYQPSGKDRFWSLLRWARGNALNDAGGLTLAPYGGDVEDDVRDINGSGRDYLLEAWYSRRFGGARPVAVTAGLIDSSNFIDGNAFAGDELTQFMNTAFVLTRLAGLPAYDPGVAVEFETGAWTLNAVAMRTHDSEAGDYTYAAAEIAVRDILPFGSGNYRLFAFTTSDDFEDVNKQQNRPLQGGGVSVDQYLNSWLGVFARFGYQSHVAPNYERQYSAGVYLEGSIWRRALDTAGLGIARLEGEDHSALTHTNAMEAWYRLVLGKRLDVTLDVQYMLDGRIPPTEDPSAVIWGTRVNLSVR